MTLERTNEDGRKSVITIPNHRVIKSSTLKMALTQANVTRDEFLAAFDSV